MNPVTIFNMNSASCSKELRNLCCFPQFSVCFNVLQLMNLVLWPTALLFLLLLLLTLLPAAAAGTVRHTKSS